MAAVNPYDRAHRRERARHQPTVIAGHAYCTEPICLHRTRWINPNTTWDLAHDRTTGQWRGPAHTRCNRAEGATYGNQHRHPHTPQPRWTSRTW